MGFSGTPKDMGPPYGKRDPYHSHIFRDSYHKGVPCPCGSLELALIIGINHIHMAMKNPPIFSTDFFIVMELSQK